jgi:hypothetical protein
MAVLEILVRDTVVETMVVLEPLLVAEEEQEQLVATAFILDQLLVALEMVEMVFRHLSLDQP